MGPGLILLTRSKRRVEKMRESEQIAEQIDSIVRDLTPKGRKILEAFDRI